MLSVNVIECAKRIRQGDITGAELYARLQAPHGFTGRERTEIEYACAAANRSYGCDLSAQRFTDAERAVQS